MKKKENNPFDYNKHITKQLNEFLDACDYFINDLDGTTCLKKEREQIRIKGRKIFNKGATS